jgi:glycosyltransferase involved in cell wall biosynthesis
MKVAYLINQYPKISHAFIRREIQAVEAAGVEVFRCSVRRSSEGLMDIADREEAGRTHVLLDAGARGLLGALIAAMLRTPLRLVRALRCAWALGRRSPRGVLRHIIYLAEACLLARRLRRQGIEHVHAHFGTNTTTVALLAHELSGLRFSFTAHGPEEFDQAWAWSLRDKIERASFVVAVSHFGRSQLFRQCAHPHWPRVHVVRCGVDGAFLDHPTQDLPRERRLISIGRLSEQKGQLLLVEALARVRQSGREVHLTLIGDGEMRPQVVEAIDRHGLGDCVQMVGAADSQTIRRALDDSSVLVLPSFAEGLPVVIMEALARSRPVLSTYVAGIPELVQPGRNGWLVPAGSVDALCAAIIEVLDASAEQLQRWGDFGRACVAEQHDVRRIGQQMAELLRESPTCDRH